MESNMAGYQQFTTYLVAVLRVSYPYVDGRYAPCCSSEHVVPSLDKSHKQA